MKISAACLSIVICVLAFMPVWGCAHSEDIVPDDGPSDFARATPEEAASYGSEVFWVAPNEQSSIAGASDRSRSTYYDGLELRVDDASMLGYDEFVRIYPGYAREGWENRGDRFLLVSVSVINELDDPIEFDVEGLTVYSQSLKLHDSSPYWTSILDFALAEQYGSLEIRSGDLGGSWGYPDGWNVVDGKQQKEFMLPFRLCPADIFGGSLEGVDVSDFFLQVYAAYSDLDAARGVRPSDCYLFALSEKEESSEAEVY